VQVAPIKPTLKPAGTKRLKLKCDEPLSNFAFNFNLRRYSKDGSARPDVPVVLEASATHSLYLQLTVCTLCGIYWLVCEFQ
jgi:hypothetical protein